MNVPAEKLAVCRIRACRKTRGRYPDPDRNRRAFQENGPWAATAHWNTVAHAVWYLSGQCRQRSRAAHLYGLLTPRGKTILGLNGGPLKCSALDVVRYDERRLHDSIADIDDHSNAEALDCASRAAPIDELVRAAVVVIG